MSEFRVMFLRPARIGPDATLALEDYARAICTSECQILVDDAGRVSGVVGDPARLGEKASADIERFFDSLSSDSADRLGWH